MINQQWVLLHKRELFQPNFRSFDKSLDDESVPCGIYADAATAKQAAEAHTSGVIYEPWRLEFWFDNTPHWVCYYETEQLICRWFVVLTPVNDFSLLYEDNYD